VTEVTERPPTRLLVAVGLVAGCTLALQVLLTRLFAAVLFYHFGFLAISLALLGTGGGGIAVYLRPRWFERVSLPAALARACAVFALLLALVPLVLVRLDYSFGDTVEPRFVTVLALACALCAVTFLAGGIAIALAIRAYARRVGRVYASDLAGAAAGALVVVPLMGSVPVPTLLVALGLPAAAAAGLLAGRLRAERRLAGLAGAVVAGVVLLSATTEVTHVKPFTRASESPVSDRWTPLNRVVGYPPPEGRGPLAYVFYDSVYTPAMVQRPGEPLPDWRRLRLGPQSIGYALTGPGRALVIGGGGGRDILNALSSGQRRVDVIELNRAIRETVDQDLGRWTGSPYTLPRVHVAIGDGRSTLAARDERYNQIHIGFTDTLSANSAQAFALTEANLYTLEAFEEYLDHLRPGGVLNVSRLRRLVGDEALRATVLTLEALRRQGVRDPRRNVVVVLGQDYLGGDFGTVLARLRPFTGAELTRVRRLARQRGLGVAYAPGGPYRFEWRGLAAASSPLAFCRSYRLNVCPPTDDKPFFFNMRRLDDLGASLPSGYFYSIDPMVILLVTLAVLVVFSVAALVLPLVLVRGARGPPPSSLVLFAAIGLGFLVLEVSLVQRFVLFLGFPTYALSIVLFSLLLFTGLGSLLTTRWTQPRRAVTVALGGALVLILAAAIGLEPLLDDLIGLPFALRVAIAVLLLIPLGVSLGTVMPVALARLEQLYPGSTPWAWGLNGVMSVVASVLAVAVAISFGFTVTTLVALGCYAVALAHVLLGRWPADTRSEQRAGAAAAEPARV
jgi:hypothetical protein